MDSAKTPKSKPMRLRFSIRAMFILCAVIAVAAGIVGRPVSNYLRENRAVQTLGLAGAEITLELIPPTERMDSLLYRLGHRSAFRHVSKVEFDREDEFSDEMAELLASLPHLSRLTFEYVPVSNAQLKRLAGSKSLEEVGIALETKPPLDLSMWSAAPSKTTPLPVTLTDEGILAFQDHPTLRWITLRGCHVSDDVYRSVLQSITKNPRDKTDDPFRSAVAAEIDARRLFEIKTSGVRIDARIGSDGFEKLTPTIDGNAKTLVLRPQGTAIDMARLQYVLSKSAKLDLRFPRDVELGSYGLKELLKEVKPYQDRIVAVTAFDTTHELWAILEQCPNLESLRILGRLERRPFDSSQPSPKEPVFVMSHRTVLSNVSPDGLNNEVVDHHLNDLVRLTSLKQLHIPNAAITSTGLQKLMDSKLKLDKLRLSNICREFVPLIEQSGLAKSVIADGNLTTGMPRTYVLFDAFGSPIIQQAKQTEGPLAVIRYKALLRGATFPGPADIPRRPEDHLRFQLRRRIIEIEDQISPKYAVKLIEETLNTSKGIQISVEELLERMASRQLGQFPLVRSTASRRKSVIPPKGGTRNDEATDESQIPLLYAALARHYETLGQIEKALEMRVRQLACSLTHPSKVRSMERDQDLRGLCQEPCETPVAKKLRDLLFLVINEEQTEYSAPTHTFADFQTGPKDIVPLLAPKGKQFASITSPEPDLQINYLQWEDGRENVAKSEIPSGHQVAYVERKFFPISVSLADFRHIEENANTDVEISEPSTADEFKGSVYDLKSDPSLGIESQINN